MAWTTYQFFLALMMVVTGSINTLVTKWADDSSSKRRDGEVRQFNHPFLQAVAMFLGEMLCLLAFRAMLYYYRERDEENLPESIKGNRQFNPLIFWPPALCDMTGTSLMYIGLTLTNSSSFQMLRGALIIFTGVLSILFLKRKLKLFQWAGMILVMIGLIIVGLSDYFTHSDSNKQDIHKTLIGDGLIILAQILTATQMIVEEKYVSGKNVSPLQAVGWEGIFGFCTLSVLLIPMYFIHVGQEIFKNPDGQIEDAIDGLYQIYNSWEVATGITGTIFSIAFFNFAGISVTKQLSATTRTVLDSIRTIVIWAFSLMMRWEKFSFYKLGGFIVLIFGMCVYNEIVGALWHEICRKRSDRLVITSDDGETGQDNDNIIS